MTGEIWAQSGETGLTLSFFIDACRRIGCSKSLPPDPQQERATRFGGAPSRTALPEKGLSMFLDKPARCIVTAVAVTVLLSACGHRNASHAAAHAPTTASDQVAQTASVQTSSMPASSATAAVSATPSTLDGMTEEQLLTAARTAYEQHRLIAPQHDNAFAYYEKALQINPDSRVAKDALRDGFPYGVMAVERAISDNRFNEAQRGIDLLAKADPDNYTLTILRTKLARLQKTQPGHTLLLMATAASWVNITDADGNEIYSGTLRAGEQHSVRSSRPLNVTVGDAAAVKVEADGQSLLLKPGNNSKVARIRVFDRPHVASSRS